MRSAIKEYLCLTETDKKDLWEKAVFVFDTNIFLNLYRYTEDTRKSLLNAMKELSDRIWMPKQVAQELMKDRPKVVFDSLMIFDEIKKEKEKFIRTCIDKLRREEGDAKIEEFSKKTDDFIAELKKESHFVENINDDKILENLLELFSGKVGNGFDSERLKKIKDEGKIRYENKIPPGYEDYIKGEQNNAYGDLIIWKEILEYAKQNNKDIIYVTGDRKEDWWHKVSGRTLGPRVELKREFLEETKKNFHMYNMNRFLVQFKEMQGSQIQQSAIDEVETYERILAEHHRQLMHEQERRQELEMLMVKRRHLKEIFRDLTKKQESIEEDLRVIDQSLPSIEELKCENFTDFEKFGILLENRKMAKASIDDIKQHKEKIRREIEEVKWQKKRIIDSDEMREKDIIRIEL